MNAKQACQTSTVRSSLFAPCSPPTIRDASSEKKKKKDENAFRRRQMNNGLLPDCVSLDAFLWRIIPHMSLPHGLAVDSDKLLQFRVT